MDKQIMQVRQKIVARLIQYLQRQKKSAPLEEIKKIITFGGKGFRPLILLETYKTLRGKNNLMVLDIACALELFHNFALIHDDIIDNSKLRRGKSSLWVKLGINKAILTGDLCLIIANELFYRTILNAQLSPKNINQLSNIWQKMQEDVILGQDLDIRDNFRNYLEKKESRQLTEIERTVWKIMEYKTASYSITTPLHLAASLVNASEDIFNAFSAYGKNLGCAFQIYDDITGMFGREEIIGKPVDSDLKEGKMTLLMVKFLGKINKQKIPRQKFADLTWVREQLKEKGVLAECLEKINNLSDRAKKTIKSASLKKSQQEFFLGLINFVLAKALIYKKQ